MRHDESYLAETLAEIKQLVLVLVTLNKRLKQRVSQLELQQQEWREEKEHIEQQLQQLQEDYEVMKFAKAVQESDEEGSAKLQISKLMREIDQCMLLIQNL